MKKADVTSYDLYVTDRRTGEEVLQCTGNYDEIAGLASNLEANFPFKQMRIQKAPKERQWLNQVRIAQILAPPDEAAGTGQNPSGSRKPRFEEDV